MHENRETSLPTARASGSPAGEGESRTTGMHSSEESDGAVIPMKPSNKVTGKTPKAAEMVEGRAPTKENVQKVRAVPAQDGAAATQGLKGVRKAARERKQERFTTLLHHLTVELLRDSYYALKREAAPGVEGVRWAEYEDGLEPRLKDLHERVHRGSYRAQASRRIYLPKPDGRQRFIQHRVADKRIHRLIQKWLKAGVSEAGEWSETTIGTPQGAVASPLLANVYLHYVFDLWIEAWREKVAKGTVMAIRYADDLVVGFERRDEAERFLREFGERLAKFGLELHPEKTRLIELGPNAARERGARGEGKPESFTFLGFTHSCGTTRQGHFKIRRQTARKRLEAKLQKIKQTLRSRMHEPIPKVGEWLRRVLVGHYQYFGVPGNWASLGLFRERIARYWGRMLGRRSQNGKVSAVRLGRLFTRWLPRPKVVHPYPEQRFAATHPR